MASTSTPGAAGAPDQAAPFTPFSPKDVAYFEKRLLEERKRVLKELGHHGETFGASQQESDGDLSSYSFHMADQGTDAMEREKAFLFASQEGRFLWHIDEALRRLYRSPRRSGAATRAAATSRSSARRPAARALLHRLQAARGRWQAARLSWRPARGPRRGGGEHERRAVLARAAFVLLADLVTKALAEAALGPPGFAHRVVGDVVRLNLVYNPGAAFGLTLGPYSRGIFLALTAVILRVLWSLYRTTRDRDNRRVFALALLVAGAVGNAFDRVRSAHGVVDFLDIGVGAHRWPTFTSPTWP
jgi:lipoprotein signal peptidase/RNA polymerase-binding transcription factor DksA